MLKPSELYDRDASSWVRKEPESLSDFTARPVMFELCDPVAGLSVLDLGCGEGYCSRALKRRGAGRVVGVDISAQMIAAADDEERRSPLGIEYRVGDAGGPGALADATFDRVLAVFLFNYLSIEQMQRCMAKARALLRPGGRFVFCVPHPSFAFMAREEPPFYFSVDGLDYFRARDRRCSGQIWKRDRTPLSVQMVHKTLDDYFTALSAAGFASMPTVRELRVLPEHLALDHAFFSPLHGLPLHLAIAVAA